MSGIFVDEWTNIRKKTLSNPTHDSFVKWLKKKNLNNAFERKTKKGLLDVNKT
jgi:hypothetical protein